MPAFHPIRVLLVEDDLDSADALTQLLEHEGFEVQETHTVSETRAALEAQRRNETALGT